MTDKIKSTLKNLEEKLLAQRNEKGVWDGYLSSSALAVAVAVFALWKFKPNKNNLLINRGLDWLKFNQNKDGGYGDTPQSKSNLSTSLLCWSAFTIVKNEEFYQPNIKELEKYLTLQMGSLKPAEISKAILTHYKDDRTFSVPILAMCALADRLGPDGWKYVPQLPYQFAVLPHQFFRFLNLSVVSYALPALISMGLIKQKKDPSKNPLMRFINKKLEKKLLKVLNEKQPPNGGFLEAIPLTGFVLMTLVGAGYKNSKVCKKAQSFLQKSIRKDGSWPIDTSLTTWVTTLAVNALSRDTFENLEASEKRDITNWLLNQQHKTVHPFTKTPPGGWAWIDIPGGVADGDDTSGALIALKRLIGATDEGKKAAKLGLTWLMGIQNSDGGFPTFCKGWGKLPFDASCPDITAHAIRAIISWKDDLDQSFSYKLNKSLNKSISYLKNTQKSDGSWLPLWFGNEHDAEHCNPVYGTSQVLIGLCNAKQAGIPGVEQMIEAGARFLIQVKNDDGSWGGNKNLPPSIEETALAIRALKLCGHKNNLDSSVNWLIENLQKEELKASPIGLYFASLWYDEQMYPLVYGIGALNEV
jgi:prenyltransferase beta subunit